MHVSYITGYSIGILFGVRQGTVVSSSDDDLWRLGLPLTSSFLPEYLLISDVLKYKLPMTKNGVVGQRTWGPKGQGLEQAPLYTYTFRSISRPAIGQMKSRSPRFPQIPTIHHFTAKIRNRNRK